MRKLRQVWISMLIIIFAVVVASAQSFRVQCPTSTITHPMTGTNCSSNPTGPGCNNSEPAYNGPTQFTTVAVTSSTVASGVQGGYVAPTKGTVNGAIKCQQISGGDGFMTEADGTQTFMFSFGPLSGLADVAAGRPSTQFPNVFNTPYPGTLTRGDPATTDGALSGLMPWTSDPLGASPAFSWNGAVGLANDIAYLVTVTDLMEGPINAVTAPGATAPGCPTTAASANTVTGWTDAPLGLPVGSQVVITNGVGDDGTPTPPGYQGTWTITCVTTSAGMSPDGVTDYAFQYVDPTAGLAADTGNDEAATASSLPTIDGHVDPRPIMDIGVMNGNIPAPLAAFDEDDEFFLTLTNVGMIMRPDLFEQHTVHFHGYPNASSFYDGVPDASVAINIGASFTYYYLAPDAGTYFWHCHITPPEHLQMGMVGQLYVRSRQDRVPTNGNLYTYLGYQNGIGEPASNSVADPRTVCNTGADILCSATMPAVNTGATRLAAGSLCNGTSVAGEGTTPNYTYNDGDGSSCYDVEYPPADAWIRSQLPLRRHDVQSGDVCGHEGQVLPAERAELPRHNRGWATGHSHDRWRNALLATFAGDHQHSSGRKGLTATGEPFGHRVSHDPEPGCSDARGGMERQAVARSGGGKHGILDQLDHPRRRRIAGRDPGHQCWQARWVRSLQGRRNLLPLHSATRSPLERRRKFRRLDDRDPYLQHREQQHLRKHVQLGEQP